MTKLSVNINKIATIRNARGGNNPDVVKVALDCERFGAEGITVHPRPDERHIRYADVMALKYVLSTEFNIEGYPQQSFNDLVLKVRPAQVTLVPDSPDQITSNAGWDTLRNYSFLKDVVNEFKEAGIRTSIFVGTDPAMIELAAKIGADRVELYTEPYATAYPSDPVKAVMPFVETETIKLLDDNGIKNNSNAIQYSYNLNINLPNDPKRKIWIDWIQIALSILTIIISGRDINSKYINL